MAPIKSKEQFLEPDPASQGLAPPLEVQYEHLLEYCQLHAGVPEDIRSYFNAVVTLWLYGWLYYPFYALADFLSSVAIEMALRERLPEKLGKDGRDRRGLWALLNEAKLAGFLRDEDFPSLKYRRQNAEELNQSIAQILGHEPEPQPEPPYADVLIECLPKIRNAFAHAKMHAILTPGQALDSLILASESINQLWPKQS